MQSAAALRVIRDGMKAHDSGYTDTDEVNPIAGVQGIRVGGITFRSEPPDLIQFTADQESKTLTLRMQQNEGSPQEEAAATAPTPFYATAAPEADTVTFEPGIITNAGRNISPTVDGGSPMSTTPRPVMTITTTGKIFLVATVDAAGAATSIDTQNAAATPTDTATEKHLELASVTLTAGVATITDRPVRESRPLYLCNGTAIWH